MKRRNESRKRILRSLRAVINLIFTALVLLAFYISVGSPAFTPKQQFRREEKANLVGPATILNTISLESYTGYDFEKLIIGTSEAGVTLFCYNYYSWRDGHSLKENDFIYRKKMEDVTVLSVPNSMASKYLFYYDIIKIPVVVFDDFPDAVRAELQIELYSVDATEPFREEYTLSANRTKKGYFLFTLAISNQEKSYGPIDAVSRLINLCDDKLSGSNTGVEIPATVRFFDKANTLIRECTVMIRQPTNEIWA